MKSWASILLLILTVYVAKNNVVTVEWDHDKVGVDHFEVQMIRDISNTVYTYGTLNLTLTIQKPKSGQYMLKVRACGDAPCSQVSDWCDSLSTCAVNSPWKVLFKPSAPAFIIGPH